MKFSFVMLNWGVLTYFYCLVNYCSVLCLLNENFWVWIFKWLLLPWVFESSLLLDSVYPVECIKFISQVKFGYGFFVKWNILLSFSFFRFLLNLLNCFIYHALAPYLSRTYLSRLSLTFSMTSVTSTALQFKFVCVTSFMLLGWLRDLPH